MRRAKPKHRRHKQSKHRLVTWMMFSILVLFITYTLSQGDKRLYPTASAAADMRITSHVNGAIDSTLSGIIADKGVVVTDFYRQSVDQAGKTNGLAVNTILVNEICSKAAVGISDTLGQLSNETIPIPLGQFLGIQILANIGPNVHISIQPIGSATVDYRTKIETAGINQIHFQVWLQVQAVVRVINPLQSSQVSVSRDIPLVNTVLTGEVPNAYLQPQLR